MESGRSSLHKSSCTSASTPIFDTEGMRLTLSLSSALLGLVSFVSASNVVDLDPSNFEKFVGGSKGALVELSVHALLCAWPREIVLML